MHPELITATDGLPSSPARVHQPARKPLRIALVQHRWHPDPEEHAAALRRGIDLAAGAGAQLVCLPELTLSPYFAIVADAQDEARERAEPVEGGPTATFAAEAAHNFGVHVHASLHEQATDGGLGYNTAILVSPAGNVVSHTR